MLEHGKRKLIAALVYTIGVFISCGILVCVNKISGEEYVQGLASASYVVMALMGANVAKGYIDRGNNAAGDVDTDDH